MATTHQFFCNSRYSAGGIAIYVSEDLILHERSDLQFNVPDCESIFVEIECDGSQNNPVFGAMYKNGFSDSTLLNAYLGEFLEEFTDVIKVSGLLYLVILI